MKMNFTKTEGNLEIVLEGRLDTTTAPEFEAFLSENIVGVDALTLDCEKLAYISSAGLRVLLSAQKRMRGAMKLKNVCELVMEVLDMTGFTDILVIE
jgi:anti-sigma B factor antagonist